MTTPAAKKAAAKRARRPVYGTWERVIIAETGEERLAFLAAHPIDRQLLKERGWGRGAECRAEFKEPRNPKFHRLAHAVGRLLVENVEEFQHRTSHEVLKEVQRRAGVLCEPMELDLGTLGKVQVQVARSLAFDEMEEDEFRVFFDGVTAHIAEHFAGVMLDEVRAEFWQMVQGER
jgi:hypothetical protein